MLENWVIACAFLLAALQFPPSFASLDTVANDFRVSTAEGEAESAIGINAVRPNEVVAGSVLPGREQPMHYSMDGGKTWTYARLPLGGTLRNPSVGWSSDGQFAYASTIGNCSLSGCDLYFYRSGDSGRSWTDLESLTPDNPRRTLSAAADRGVLHVDRHGESSFLDRIYITYHSEGVLYFSRSADFGDTWRGLKLASAADELGAGGDIATDRNGRVYFFWPAYLSRTIRLKRSADGGESFGASVVVAETEAAYSFPLPAQETHKSRVYVAAGADLTDGPFANSLYVVWGDTTAPVSNDPAANHARIQVAYSRDGGDTWTVTTPHPVNDAGSVDRWHPFLAVGPDGTIHIIFYDTRNFPTRTGVDLFYTYSSDGGASWSAPVRVSSMGSPNIDNPFEFGDYNGLDVAGNNVVASFSDNRSESGTTDDSVDVYAARIAPGSTGEGAGRMNGSRGVLGPPLLVARNANGTDFDLTWSSVCGIGTDYAVYEGVLGDPHSKSPIQCSTNGATFATISPGSSNRFFVVVARTNTVEGSYGRDSNDIERTPDPGACLPQLIGACP